MKKAYLLKCCTCNPSTTYRVFKKLCQENIIKDTYLELLKQYLKKTPAKKLKCKIVDSTVIPNKYGIDKVAYNTHYGRKRVTKISVVPDFWIRECCTVAVIDIRLKFKSNDMTN